MANLGRLENETSKPVDPKTINLIAYWKQFNRGQLTLTKYGQIAPDTIAANLVWGIKKNKIIFEWLDEKPPRPPMVRREGNLVKAFFNLATFACLEEEIINKLMPKDVPPYFVNPTQAILEALTQTPAEKRKILMTMNPINLAIIETYNYYREI